MVDFSAQVKSRTLITGGHFVLTENGPNINSGTIDSFQKAADLYSSMRGRCASLALGLLINDIGAVCSASSCSMISQPSKTNFILPESYLQILKTFEIEEDNLILFWEKHMRNRGKKLLMRENTRKNNNIDFHEGGYVYSSSDENIQILLTRASTHDKHGTPACPLIMCGYASAQEKMGFDRSINFYYVGKDNFQNVVNHHVIEKGKYLASHFGITVDVKNIYLFEDGVMCNYDLS